MYHNFFIHSSIDGHLGHFHVLAIVNSAVMNTVMCLFQFWSSQGICLGVGLLGHMENTFSFLLLLFCFKHCLGKKKKRGPLRMLLGISGL